MTTVTMVKIIKEIEIATYGNTEICNCVNCRKDRFNKHENRLLLQVAPSILVMPLKMDRQSNYNRYSTEFKYMSSAQRQKATMRKLKSIESLNKIFKKEHKSSSTIKVCINCGKSHILKYNHTIIHKDKKYFLCSTCVTSYETCKCCNILKRTGVFRTAYKNYEQYKKGDVPLIKICRECFHNHYKKCNICGYKQINSQFLSLPHRSHAGEFIACIYCCETSKVLCYNCKETTYTFLNVNSVMDRYYCPICSELRTPIHEHTYKPLIQHFHKGLKEGKVSSSALHFGFELEIERYTSILGRTTMAELIKDKFNTDYIYIVHDGSIDEGIEVISHPFTWNEYKENINRWTNLLLFIRTKEWKANRPKVGFHVHMTKAAFNTFHLFKFLKFFYQKHNRDFIYAIAQRQSTTYSLFSTADNNNIIANAKNKANRSKDHYNAVNLNNENTIEIRMFRGTLEPLYFHKNIEFLQAVFKYTRDHNPKQMEYVSFINYVQQYRKLYPCLWEFLTNDVGIKKNMIIKERKV